MADFRYGFIYDVTQKKYLLAWKDKHWEDAFNAICRIPPSGRILKVVFRKEKSKIKIITAFWLD